MRRTKEEAAATREAVLDAALAVFGRQGYAATTLSDIGRAANVSRGAVYWHFGGKAMLYAALVAERFGQATAAITAAAEGGRTPLESIRALLVSALRHLEDDREYRAVVELTLFKAEALPELAGSIDTKREVLAAQRRMLRGAIEAGMAAGDIRPDVAADVAALALLGFLNGLAVVWLLDPSAFSLRDRAEATVDVALAGLVP
jgi:TetR/AcrR family acrAB operon transcriptional repressor